MLIENKDQFDPSQLIKLRTKPLLEEGYLCLYEEISHDGSVISTSINYPSQAQFYKHKTNALRGPQLNKNNIFVNQYSASVNPEYSHTKVTLLKATITYEDVGLQ